MSEQLRINNIVEQAKRCNASTALARARALYGSQPCESGACGLTPSTKQVQTQSQRLAAAATACAPFVREPVVPESTRIARLITNTLYEETNPTNPTTRFSEYVRFFPTPCPPPDTLSYVPIPSTACPLPNTPLNPVLPA